MSISWREFWTVFHGMIAGAGYLLAFAGGLAGLAALAPGLSTEEGIARGLRRLRVGTWSMAILCWLTVVSGTYLVYPWYREKSPTSPKSVLLADPATAAWHTFAMEWKEHVAWISPILATAAAALVSVYGVGLTRRLEARRAVTALFVLAFATAAVGGVLGAFLNKIAAVR